MKVLIVIGTRPEAIKCAPVWHALRERGVTAALCHTGQHEPAMVDPALALLGAHVEHRLTALQHGASLATLTANLCAQLDPLVAAERPDWVLVQGDTTTAMVAGLVAHYHRLRVGHIEAGLRSGDARHPFPEEMNRRLLGQLAEAHFAPTTAAREALLREGVAEERIALTGNPGIDALLQAVDRLRAPNLAAELEAWSTRELQFDHAAPALLVTCHRRENAGPRLDAVLAAVVALTRLRPALRIYLPVHPNPDFSVPIRRALSGLPAVRLVEPLPYAQQVWLLDHSDIVLTDSGGLQEEAPALGKPVLVLRDVTERPEGVALGVARLVGCSTERIIAGVEALLDDKARHEPVFPYGDGHAAERIAEWLTAG